MDEDYWDLDTDNDGLTDYDEFHNITTDHLDGDTDDDGLPDGLEYNQYASLGANPLVHDEDSDVMAGTGSKTVRMMTSTGLRSSRRF